MRDSQAYGMMMPPQGNQMGPSMVGPIGGGSLSGSPYPVPNYNPNSQSGYNQQQYYQNPQSNYYQPTYQSNYQPTYQPQSPYNTKQW